MEDVKAAVNGYQKQIDSLFSHDGEWPAIKQQLDNAEADFLAACAEQGLTPEEVSRIQEIDRSLRAKQAELDGKKRQLEDLVKELAPLNEKYAALLAIWRSQFQLRQEAAKRANAIGATLHQKFLDVTVHYCGDRPAFEAIWNRVAPRDGRTVLARQWDALGESLFEHAVESDLDSPWAALEGIMNAPDAAPAGLKDWVGPLTEHLRSDSVHSQWEEVHLLRIPDLIDLALFRADGTRAGSV